MLGAAALAASGPLGRPCALPVGDQVVVSSCSETLLDHGEEWGGKGITAQIIMQCAQGHRQRFGDGGLRVAALACELVDSVQRQGLHHLVAADSFQRAAASVDRWVQQAVDGGSLGKRMEWASLHDASSLVASTILAKPLLHSLCQTPSDIASLCNTTLQSFLHALNEQETGALVPSVRVVGSMGRGIQESQALLSTVLLILPTPPRLPQDQGDPTALPIVSVALFDVSVQAETNSTPGLAPQPSGSSADGVLEDGEKHMLERVLGTLVKLRVGVVASQKLVHPWLREALGRSGIVVLERLSILHISSVQQLSGALPLSDWTAAGLDASKLGVCHSPTQRLVGSQKFLQLVAPAEDDLVHPSFREVPRTRGTAAHRLRSLPAFRAPAHEQLPSGAPQWPTPGNGAETAPPCSSAHQRRPR